MDLLLKYLDELRQKFVSFSPNKKLSVIALSAAGIGVVATLSIWALKTNYTYLYTNLDPALAGQITSKLESYNIPFKVSASGTGLLVPEKSLYTARMKLASEGLPNSGRVGYEIFDKTNLGMTDFVQKINYRRALEGELAKSIMELDAVQDARVHLVIPEHRLFAKDQEEATASILLSLQFDGGLSAGQVKGITHLVASSV